MATIASSNKSIWRDALRALELDYTLAFPALLQHRCGGATDVVGRDHRHSTVERLKATLDKPALR